MKPKLLTSALLFISAYSPLFLILAVKDFDFAGSINFKHPTQVYILLGLSFISIALLFLSFKLVKRGNMPVEIKLVKTRSVDLINYTIPYIVSFFGFDLSKTEDVISLSLFLLLMFLLTVKSKSVFMNPILLLGGYNLYDIDYVFDKKTSSIIAISKHEMKMGEVFYMRSLTRFLYLVTEKQTEIQNEESVK